VGWLVETQNNDGSWGWQTPTAEETAYCLQALLVWQKIGREVPKTKIKKAVEWLKGHCNPPFPPLWIGKGLYTPEKVVRSSILSAILMEESR